MKSSARMIEARITHLLLEKILYAIESLVVLVLVLFVSALLPSLLLRYVFTDPNMMAPPAFFEHIPAVAFVIGVGFFIFALVTNIMRMLKMRKFQMMLRDMDVNGCCGDGSCCEGGCCEGCNCDMDMAKGAKASKPMAAMVTTPAAKKTKSRAAKSK